MTGSLHTVTVCRVSDVHAVSLMQYTHLMALNTSQVLVVADEPTLICFLLVQVLTLVDTAV